MNLRWFFAVKFLPKSFLCTLFSILLNLNLVCLLVFCHLSFFTLLDIFSHWKRYYHLNSNIYTWNSWILVPNTQFVYRSSIVGPNLSRIWYRRLWQRVTYTFYIARHSQIIRIMLFLLNGRNKTDVFKLSFCYVHNF